MISTEVSIAASVACRSCLVQETAPWTPISFSAMKEKQTLDKYTDADELDVK